MIERIGIVEDQRNEAEAGEERGKGYCAPGRIRERGQHLRQPQSQKRQSRSNRAPFPIRAHCSRRSPAISPTKCRKAKGSIHILGMLLPWL